MRLTPDFSISADGQDRSALLRPRLQRLTLNETTGAEADELELEFDDQGAAIALPRHGAKLALAIGYAGEALVQLGSFTVDETEIKGPPDTVCVRAKSADVRASLKSHKHRAWRQMSAKAIVDQIAAEHGLTSQVHPDLANITVAHRDQAGESDLHFLTRMGRDHDAVASVKGGKLIYAPKGRAASGSGRSLTPLVLTRSQLTSWSMKDADRAKHARVRARHHDFTAAAIVYVEAGAGDPSKTLRHPFPSAAVAGAAAHAEHRKLKRKAHTVELELPGEPSAFAGRPITLSGIRTGINGRWIASRVEQELDFGGGGFTTRIEATVDGLDADTGDAAPGYAGDDADPSAPEEGDE